MSESVQEVQIVKCNLYFETVSRRG